MPERSDDHHIEELARADFARRRAEQVERDEAGVGAELIAAVEEIKAKGLVPADVLAAAIDEYDGYRKLIAARGRAELAELRLIEAHQRIEGLQVEAGHWRDTAVKNAQLLALLALERGGELEIDWTKVDEITGNTMIEVDVDEENVRATVRLLPRPGQQQDVDPALSHHPECVWRVAYRRRPEGAETPPEWLCTCREHGGEGS